LRPVHRALAYLIGLILLCDLAVIGIHVLDANTSLVTGRAGSGRGEEGEGVAPAPGQVFLTGEVERLVADNAQSDALSTPLTITAVERGTGRLTIEKALVGGRRVDISWDGGTPLPVTGDGRLDLGAAHVEVDAEAVVWSIDGAPRTFAPGAYRLGGPVAVGGAGGLATSREGVEFSADQQTLVASRGKVVVREAARRLVLMGPGKLTVTGELRLRYPERRASARSVTFGEGPFRVTLEPRDGKVRVDAVLQGAVEAS
jgi:hypothetical protein